MPSTVNFDFAYESPSSLPGISLTGGPGGDNPILAIQVDTAMSALSSAINSNTASIATNTSGIATANTNITNLQNWTGRGSTSFTFVTLSSSTAAVNFGFTFPGVPTVTTNINSSAAATARWESRAHTITTTGFTMFVYSSQATTASWTDVAVSYVVHYD
jgi:hypothetical protein